MPAVAAARLSPAMTIGRTVCVRDEHALWMYARVARAIGQIVEDSELGEQQGGQQDVHHEGRRIATRASLRADGEQQRHD